MNIIKSDKNSAYTLLFRRIPIPHLAAPSSFVARFCCRKVRAVGLILSVTSAKQCIVDVVPVFCFESLRYLFIIFVFFCIYVVNILFMLVYVIFFLSYILFCVHLRRMKLNIQVS